MAIRTQILSNMGLTDGEIKVYLALIKLGKSSTGNIIKNSKVHASKVYPILDRLIDKGLVSYIREGKKRVYAAKPPMEIMTYLASKEAEIEEMKKDAEGLVQELETMQKVADITTDATVFRGLKGFRSCVNEFVSTSTEDEETIILGVSDFETVFQREFIRSTKMLQGRVKVCVSENAHDMIEKLSNTRVSIKRVQEQIVAPSLFIVQKTHVLITVDQGNASFLIQNSELADSLRKYFSNFWESKTRTYTGTEGAVRVLHELMDEAKKGYTHYGFGSDENPYDVHLREELDWFNEQEGKFNTDGKLLFMKGSEGHRNPYSKRRYLPKEFISPLRIMICNDKVFMVDFSEPWTTIIIEKKEIADVFIKHFELLWNMADEG